MVANIEQYFLFYSTIALCFSTIQPLVLPVTFFYFFIDSFLKKYTLMYVFVSKIESGGTFWRMIFNRILFATFMFNMVVSLVVWSRYTGKVACYVLPLPFVLILFKIYCHRTMDMDTRYYTRGSDRDSILGTGALDKPDRLAKRYCHPALHQQLIRPMVPGKAEHLMAGIYGTTHERGIGLDNLEPSGKKKKPTAGFEVVQEEDMDFANFKHRAEFGQDHGGGAMYGDEFSTMGGGSATGSPGSSRPGSPGMAPMVMSDSPHPYGYRGVDYSRMPSYQQRPDSVDYSNMDTRSDIGSVTNLLAGQQNYQPHQHSGLNPAQEQEHLIQQQQYHEQQQQYPEQQYQQQQQQYSEQQYQQQQNQQQQNQQQHPYQHPPTQQTWPHNEGYEGYRGAGPRQ